jgi:DNA-binding FadR family transcriptional regulator
MPVGSPFPSEPELIATYGVSKSVVRETVQALDRLGLVRLQHGKRSVVRPQSEWNILSPLVQVSYREEGLARELLEELYAVRFILEPNAARWAAEHADPAQSQELQAIVGSMKLAMQSPADRNAEFLAHDRQFHLLVAELAGNVVLWAIIRDIRELLTTTWSVTELSPRALESVLTQHAAIAEAIERGDADRAEVAMREHLDWAAATDASDIA